MKLIQVLDRKIHGYWDGGAKDTFTWSIEGSPQHDSKGAYVRVGSWEANHWFHVALGETTKLTLANAKRRLLAGMKKYSLTGHFTYKED